MVLRFEKLARVASSAPSSFTFAFKPSFSAGESLFVVEKVQRVYRRLETLTWLLVDRLHKSQPLWPEGRGENPPRFPVISTRAIFIALFIAIPTHTTASDLPSSDVHNRPTFVLRERD